MWRVHRKHLNQTDLGDPAAVTSWLVANIGSYGRSVAPIDFAVSGEHFDGRWLWEWGSMQGQDALFVRRFDKQAEEYLFQEVTQLRVQIRLWNAATNVNMSRWFGGSQTLRGETLHAFFVAIAMRIRRLLKPGRKNDHSVPRYFEHVLKQVPPGPRRANLEAAKVRVDEVLSAVSAEHFTQLVDKSICHAASAQLNATSSSIPGLAASKVNYRMVVDLVNELSLAYGAINPALARIDPTINYRDPLMDRVREVGLPLIDFDPVDILVDEAADRDGIYIGVHEDEWAELVRRLAKPWPKGAATVDFRLERARWLATGTGYVDRDELARRWGWDIQDVYALANTWDASA